MRWITTTNHKDIGTLYLWFSVLDVPRRRRARARHPRRALRARVCRCGTREFFNQLTTMHGVIMVFGAIMPAFVGFANWQVPMMIGAPDMAFARHEQLELLAAAVRRLAPRHLVLRARRCDRRGLDALRAADDADGAGHGSRDLRAPHHGRVVDHGVDQHRHHDPQHARARHDADEDAALRVDVADNRLSADRGDAGARGRDHDDCSPTAISAPRSSTRPAAATR